MTSMTYRNCQPDVSDAPLSIPVYIGDGVPAAERWDRDCRLWCEDETTFALFVIRLGMNRDWIAYDESASVYFVNVMPFTRMMAEIHGAIHANWDIWLTERKDG